jgi:hypothetical protein
VFDMPSFRDLPVPLPSLRLPSITPMELPPVGRLFPPLPQGRPVPVPMANAVEAWAAVDTGVSPEPVAVAEPPPLFGFGPSAVPFDLTAIVADPGTDRQGDR